MPIKCNVSSLKSLFSGKTESTYLQLIRYTFVGGIAFAVDFSALFVFTEFFKLHYLVSACIAFLFGLTVNYALSVAWVFSTRKVTKKWIEFAIFALIGLISLSLNELLMWLLTDVFLIYYLISKIFTTILIYLFNFFARKVFLFNK